MEIRDATLHHGKVSAMSAKRSTALPVILAIATLAAAAGVATRRSPASQSESEIRERVSRARSDMRSMDTAIQSYMIDYYMPPRRTSGLTTPVAYLTSIFSDPFADVFDGGPPPTNIQWFAPPDGTLRYGMGREDAVVVYSIGPDGVDSGGEPAYDPTNGIVSGGDIVRVLEMEGPIVFGEGQRVVATQIAISAVYEAALSWGQEHNAWPSSMDDLTSPMRYLREIPADPYGGEGAKISIGAGENPGELAIYSVGPDGDDDFGLLALRGIIPEGAQVDGDIVKVLTAEDLAKARRGWEMPPPDEDQWLVALKKRIAEDGRPNALLNYYEANRTAPPIGTSLQQDLLSEVARNGWSESTAALGPWLDLWAESFGHIRAGVAVEYASGIGHERGHRTPVPNFLHAQTAGRALCASSARRMANGDAEGAVDDALTALEFGCDMGAEGGMLISSLISIALEQVALRQIGNLLATDSLTPEQLERIRYTLAHVEREHPGVAAGFRGEAAMMAVTMKEMAGRVDGTIPPEPDQDPGEIEKLCKEVGLSRSEVPAMIARVAAANARMHDALLADMAKPVAQRRSNEELQALLTGALTAKEAGIFACAIPNFTEAGVREATVTARLRLTQAETALRANKRAGGPTPGTLDELVPARQNAVPNDPFTGEPLQYRLGEGGAWQVWSVGPDFKSDDAGLRYDPTNGTVSTGDVLLGF